MKEEEEEEEKIEIISSVRLVSKKARWNAEGEQVRKK